MPRFEDGQERVPDERKKEKPKRCPYCKGTGKLKNDNKCPACDGTGIFIRHPEG